METTAGASRIPGVLEAIATTRAIRRYRLDEPISEDDLAAILFAASRAPTGSNRQTFRFLVLRRGERALRAKAVLGQAFRQAWQVKRAEDGYDPEAGDSPRARMARTMEHFVAHFEDTPVVVLVCLVRYRAHNLIEALTLAGKRDLNPRDCLKVLCLFRLASPSEHPYGSPLYGSRYQGQRGPTPSRSWQGFRRWPTGGQPQTFQIRFVEVDVAIGERWQMVAWQATRLPSP